MYIIAWNSMRAKYDLDLIIDAASSPAYQLVCVDARV